VEICEGLIILGRGGICVEPTSAVVVKALEHLEDAGTVGAHEQVVLVLSGFGLKTGQALQQVVGVG
jgi:threonine synthase